MNCQEHWENVYRSKPAESLGWYLPRLRTSLAWIRELGLDKDAPIIDVGGGASTLIDDLIDDGYRSVTVLDISGSSLAQSKARLGEKAVPVTWLVGDITQIELPGNKFDVWHDRAVFHFLTETEQQRQYRDVLLASLKPGGHLIIGTFAPEAPPKCSGLPVQRYDREQLVAALGSELELIREHKEMHVTPGGVEQMYLYCQFRRC